MKTLAYAVLSGLIILYAASASAKCPQKGCFVVEAEGIGADGFIAPEYAFCAPAKKNHVTDGNDKSIGLSWSKGPKGTKSYAIIAVDTDVPTVFDNANKEGKTIPATLPRKDFYHWVLFDIPATMTSLPAGADSQSHAPNGKSELKTPYGIRGINDYAPYFAAAPAHRGVYAGYDGPCPPWNDEMVHHYHFTVFALDVASLGFSDKPVTGPEALAAIKKHTLTEGGVVGKYSLNPDLHK